MILSGKLKRLLRRDAQAAFYVSLRANVESLVIWRLLLRILDLRNRRGQQAGDGSTSSTEL